VIGGDVGQPHQCLDADHRANGVHQALQLTVGQLSAQWLQGLLDPGDAPPTPQSDPTNPQDPGAVGDLLAGLVEGMALR
jgi:hypothetical protein